MIKQMLYAGAAVALVAVPGTAMAQDIDGDLNFDNNIQTSLVNNSTYNANTALYGDVEIDGTIEIDSSAVSINDSKQILTGNAVIIDSDDALDGDDEDALDVFNATNAYDVNGDGNVGVNAATGAYNMQSNIGVISVASGDAPGLGEGGWAKANTTTAQSVTGTLYGAGDELDAGVEDETDIRNVANGGNVAGAGNIGVNVAAGAFNAQQNLMTLAVATESSLAEASAGVVQFLAGNANLVGDVTNVANAGTVGGAGNVSVNLASGVGNMQHNSLTVAASGAFGGNGTGNPGAGGF